MLKLSFFIGHYLTLTFDFVRELYLVQLFLKIFNVTEHKNWIKYFSK